MFHSVLLRAALLTLVLSAFFSSADAVPLVLSHQGRLLDASDAPLSGMFTIIYSIYDVPTGGAPLWTEDHVGVVVTGGLFSVELGGTVPLTADIVAGNGGGGGGGGAIRYLQIQIAGQPPISPRTALVSSPYSVATSRVSGDVQTAPGELKVSAASDTKRIGIRVADSLAEASSIAIDEPGVQIALRITPDSTVFDQGESSGSRAMVHRIHRGEDGISQTITPTTCGVAINQKGTGADKNRVVMQSSSSGPTPEVSLVLDRDSDGDGVPEGEISQSVKPTTSSVAIKTKGTGADANRTASLTVSASPGGSVSTVAAVDLDGDGIAETSVNTDCDASGASQVMEKKGLNAVNVKLARSISSPPGGLTVIDALDLDSDDDGVMDRSISSSCDATAAKHAINTKGTGGNRSISSTCDDLGVVHALDVDSDADGVPEGEISQSVTPTTCGVAIKTKGTGADPNRVVSSQTGTTPFEVSGSMSIDDDGDTVPESEISQSVTPTTCGVAIKTKGTGADKDRTISSDCDDSTAVQIVSTDEDGDGITNGSVKISSGASLLGGALPGGAIISARCDADDDGVAEQEIDQVVTPTTCSVAIKTKGTGADANRVIGATDDTTATMLMATDSASISMKVRNGGVIKGSIIINNGSALRMVEMGSDGNSYFASGVGIGVDPTHHIDVVGGAYCDGTNWVNASDKNSKENFEKVDGGEILEKISELEITKWNYKGNDDAQHIGPTAQDFKKTFGVGADDKSISTIDPSGIALAAIKELYLQLKSKDKEMDEQLKVRDKQIKELQEQLMKMQTALNKK